MKKIWTIRLCAFSFALSVLFVSCTKEKLFDNKNVIEKAQAINFTPAKTSAELKALRAQKSANIVRTLKDFDAIVSLHNTPLSKLSSKHLEEFRNSLVIRDSIGVVSLYYGDLKENLSYDDFSAVLALFGLDIKNGYWGLSDDPLIQSKLVTNDYEINSIEGEVVGLPADHAGYTCSTILEHSCRKLANNICLSGC